jgi:hypothetical protein
MITLPSSFSRITVPRLAQPVIANKRNRPVKANIVKIQDILVCTMLPNQ